MESKISKWKRRLKIALTASRFLYTFVSKYTSIFVGFVSLLVVVFVSSSIRRYWRVFLLCFLRSAQTVTWRESPIPKNKKKIRP